MAGSSKKVPETGDSFRDIVEMVRLLREPGGCPWDMRQDLESGVKELLDEAEEVGEAIAKGDTGNLCEELGDLIWSIVFTANIARENDLFGIEDILKQAKEKMVRRHPHVFGNVEAKSAEHAMELFQEAKRKEKEMK
jgi:tetrapyrrole methylase family protein / MazG family protein